MIYEIKNNNKIIGTTDFEIGDPPMGFVVGEVSPTHEYKYIDAGSELSVYVSETQEKISCEGVTIEDYSEELGEQSIEVTALIESAEEYDKFFMHHRKSYEKQFT